MPRRNRTPHPHKRKGFWYLARRVPQALATYDRRGLVLLSTGIRVADDPRGHAATEAVAKLDAGLAQYWRDLKAGRDPAAEVRYKKALDTARRMGVEYQSVQDVARMPVADVVRRVELLDNRDGVESGADVSAALCGEQPPHVMISQMREIFEEIMATSLLEKSPRQLKKWRVQRNAAVETLLVGILNLTDP